jgi:L-seryl-tRNA(Ser) seleniumtransferase
VSAAVGGAFTVGACACASQIGSGALPSVTLPSAGLSIRPTSQRGSALAALADALRRLPMPVVGRIDSQALVLDLRCLEDEAAFLANLAPLEAA